MKRYTLFLLTLLLTLTGSSCAKEEATNTAVTPARPFVSANTGNSTPRANPSPQSNNINAGLDKARSSPANTPTASTPSANDPSDRAGKRTASAGNDYYINSEGERVRRPVRSATAPAGATARCQDGTYSFSRNRRGTCSHHGGVAEWL
jgi:hypothetical protein